jgi:cellulose synthase (UDP-forming)
VQGERESGRRLLLIREMVVLTAALGSNYIIWRWLFSVDWSAWPVALPLILAETYSFVDGLLFGFTMCRLKERDRAILVAEITGRQSALDVADPRPVHR